MQCKQEILNRPLKELNVSKRCLIYGHKIVYLIVLMQVTSGNRYLSLARSLATYEVTIFGHHYP